VLHVFCPPEARFVGVVLEDAGVVYADVLASLNVTGCLFLRNGGTNFEASGSPVQAVFQRSPQLRILISNCTFRQNRSPTTGGACELVCLWSVESVCCSQCACAVEFETGTPQAILVTNCTFDRNVAGDRGGAVHVSGVNARLVVLSSVFTRNVARVGNGVAAVLYLCRIVFSFFSILFHSWLRAWSDWNLSLGVF
jgi:predicted outer membrane repeat protein